VVVTHHGEDYNRQKWGVVARSVLRLGERFGMKFANARIAISSGIRNLVMHQYAVDSAYISNGVALPPLTGQSVALEKFDLVRRRYVLLVSRMVPEKRHLDLIRAFLSASMPGWKLVLVGKADHHDAYVDSVLAAAKLSPNIVGTGYQGGQALHELYLHAGVFVLPSSHEGLPISILEALSYGLPVIASDIPSNREIANCGIEYFPVGDISALQHLLDGKVTAEFQTSRSMHVRSMIRSNFQWSDVAKKTYAVYRSVCPNAQLQDEPLAKFCSQASRLRD
jgi:glycosyltransferase involved in cell wall biosynthesis